MRCGSTSTLCSNAGNRALAAACHCWSRSVRRSATSSSLPFPPSGNPAIAPSGAKLLPTTCSNPREVVPSVSNYIERHSKPKRPSRPATGNILLAPRVACSSSSPDLCNSPHRAPQKIVVEVFENGDLQDTPAAAAVKGGRRMKGGRWMALFRLSVPSMRAMCSPNLRFKFFFSSSLGVHAAKGTYNRRSASPSASRRVHLYVGLSRHPAMAPDMKDPTLPPSVRLFCPATAQLSFVSLLLQALA